MRDIPLDQPETYVRLATLAGDTGRALKSVEMIAAGPIRAMLLTWAGGGDDSYRKGKDGISTLMWQAWPRTLLWRASEMLDETHVEACATAWCMGAWDVSIWSFPAAACRATPHVPWALSAADLDDVGEASETIRLAAHEEGMTVWDWCPMAFGPQTRRRKWLGKDTTLSDDGTRSIEHLPCCGPPRPMPAITGAQHVMRFGRARP